MLSVLTFWEGPINDAVVCICRGGFSHSQGPLSEALSVPFFELFVIVF